MDAAESSKSSKAVVEKTRQPPPPSPENKRTRRQVILSFWAIVIFLGLPIWWKTTAIYRANLPVQAMIDWADGKICKPTFPLRIAVETPLSQQETQSLLKTTQHALDDLNDFSAHHIRLILADKSSNTSQILVPPESTAEHIIVKDDVALLVRLKPASNNPTPSSKLHTYS